jgi:GABA permease
MRILMLVSEAASGDVLKTAIGDGAAEDAEVLVVAPALNSRVRFFASDPDPAIRRAEGVAQETAERLGEAGIDAAPDTGESDPLQAIEDALVSFDADEIVLCTHKGGKRNWLEDGVVDDAEKRFDLPVRHFQFD